MSSTDYLRLSEHKIFKELRESLPKDLTKTLNLLAIRDNVLFTWDFHNNYVMTLNIKAARSREGDNIIHQKLLPLCPPLFSPEFLVLNESGTLLAVAGPSGVLVLQLPMRCPPYGNFDNNKEVIYCRSHSLDERLLACSETIEVRQVKFHPASTNDNHVLVLTSDNILRLYQIENNDAISVGVFSVGEKPGGLFPGSKTPFLDIYGEIAVDFDFGHPEFSETAVIDESEDVNRIVPRKYVTIEDKSLVNAHTQTSEKIVPKNLFKTKEQDKKKRPNLAWPVYILRGDSRVYSINIDLNNRSKPVLKGPLPLSSFDAGEDEACSIVCLNTSPQVLCIAMSNGALHHSVLLDIENDIYDKMKERAVTTSAVPSKEIIGFEVVELELGLSTSDDDLDAKYKCPIRLHVDDSRIGRYFATHSAGVHSVTISSLDDLQNYVSGPENSDPTPDIFRSSSTAEYILCTKTSSSKKVNPVLGFSLYYEPTSVIALLGDGRLVTLAILYTALPPKIEDLQINDKEITSPLKKMLKEPFDQYIQKILKKSVSQPVLKLRSHAGQTQEQYYELLQRAVQVFREDYFKHHTRAREEIDKRIQTLNMLKKNQQKEIERMDSERDVLREKAGSLAEKYEDIKDKQDELLKRCENLLLMVSRKRYEPSDAEKAFMDEMKMTSRKVVDYDSVIDKIKNKMKYQQVQMENWKAQEVKKVTAINETHSNTIKTNLTETTKKITEMIKDVNEYKRLLNIN